MDNLRSEPKFCRKCGHEKLVKKGKAYANIMKGIWRQKYECAKCHFKFAWGKRQMSEPMPFKYQSQPIPPTDWKAYNEYQAEEAHMFDSLIDELLEQLSIEKIQKTGRPISDIKDVIFCMLLKVYYRRSAGRLMSTLEDYKQKGFLQKVPSRATILNYFNNKKLCGVLTSLIELSARPLVQCDELVFGVDSTGFSTSRFGHWSVDKNNENQERVYRKAHITIGVKTNVVTSAVLTDQFVGDAPQLKYLVKRTALAFDVKEVVADKGYLSKENYNFIDEIGATGFIPFKSNSNERGRGNGPVWRKALFFFQENPQKFNEHYHKRSNVETTFYMIKQKFGDILFTKNLTANFSEMACKIICHNICCLIRAYYKFDLKNTFWTEVPKNQKVSFKA